MPFCNACMIYRSLYTLSLLLSQVTNPTLTLTLALNQNTIFFNNHTEEILLELHLPMLLLHHHNPY